MLKLKKILIIAAALNAVSFFVASTASAQVTPEDREKFEKGKYILLQVKIPSPSCAGVAQNASFNGNEDVLCCQHKVIQDIVAEKNLSVPEKGQMSCPTGSIAAVKNAPVFVISFFQFLIVFLAIVVTGVLVVAGVLYITSGGNPSKASKALDWMRNAAYSLVVLIFSTVILNQIGPRFTSLGITDVADIVGKFLCTELTDQPACDKGNNCTWNIDRCMNTASVKCYDLAETQCRAQTGRCEWGSSSNTCLTVRSSTVPCSVATDSGNCYSNVGCAWQENTLCLGNEPSAEATCNTRRTFETCTAGGNACRWVTQGCYLETEISTTTVTCANYSSGDCPTSWCYFSNGQCRESIKPGEACTSRFIGECGSQGFCDEKTSVCRAKFNGGEKCTADMECLSDDCMGLVGAVRGGEYNTCTTPGNIL